MELGVTGHSLISEHVATILQVFLSNVANSNGPTMSLWMPPVLHASSEKSSLWFWLVRLLSQKTYIAMFQDSESCAVCFALACVYLLSLVGIYYHCCLLFVSAWLKIILQILPSTCRNVNAYSRLLFANWLWIIISLICQKMV